MADLATIARPYAEALFKAAGVTDAAALKGQLAVLAAVAAHDDVRLFADNPKVGADQVYDVFAGAARTALDSRVSNLLRVIIENGRLPALPEVAAQYQALVNASAGSSDARVESAFPLDGAQLAEVSAVLEQRFGRKLNIHVDVRPELIGGIRVTVGDQVLDTSVQARLEQMKVALAV